MRKATIAVIALALCAAGLLAGLRPSIGSAHTGNAAISCTAVTFNYADFAAGVTNTVSESITVDGSSVHSGTFSFTGSGGSHTVSISVGAGEHSVVASASWNTNGHQGSFREYAKVECGDDTTTTTTTQPPERCPPGMTPTAGKDGEPGNDECEYPPGTTTTTTTTTEPPPTTTTTEPPVTTEPAVTTEPEPTEPEATTPDPPPVATPNKPRKPFTPDNPPPLCVPGMDEDATCSVQGSG